MQAKINAPLGYKCAPLGKIVQHFPLGATVDGQVAQWAIADGAAVPLRETKVEMPLSVNWRNMSWPELRSYAASLTDDPIRNKDDAIAAIEAAR